MPLRKIDVISKIHEIYYKIYFLISSLKVLFKGYVLRIKSSISVENFKNYELNKKWAFLNYKFRQNFNSKKFDYKIETKILLLG